MIIIILRLARMLKKSPGDLRRLAATQIPVKDHGVKNSQRSKITTTTTVVVVVVRLFPRS